MSVLTPRPLRQGRATPVAALVRRSSSAVAFGLVGLSGIAVNQMLLAGLVAEAHVNYLVAAVLASAGSTTTNFLLTEHLVFRARRGKGVVTRFLGYMALTLASTPVRLPILYVLTSLHGVNYLVSNLVAIVTVFGGRYVVSALVIWRSQVPPSAEVHAPE